MTPTRSGKKFKKQSSKFPALLLLIAAVLVLGGAVFLIAKSFTGFQAKVDNYGPFIHKSGDTAFTAPPAIWDETNVSRYENLGVGLSIPFTKVLASGKSIKRKFELEHWTKYQEEGDQPKRRSKVREGRKRFDEMVTWLNRREVMTRNVLAFVDDTGKITADDSRLIQERLGDYNLEQSVTNGDALKFRGCWISSSRFENCLPTVNVQAGETAKAQELQTAIKKISAEKPDQPSTSLYEGFANVLIPLSNGNNLPEEVAAFTDGVENCREIQVSFYNKGYRKLLREKKYDDIRKAVETRKVLPDLKGVAVTFYGPRRGTGEERQLIDDSLDFAVWLFTQHGATARKFYE